MVNKPVKPWVQFLPFISSILLVLPFTNYHLSFVALFALIPYLFFLKSELAKPHPRILLVTWVMGLFACLGVTGWLALADTAGWLSVSGFALTAATFGVWLLLGASLSIGYVIFALLLKRFHGNYGFFITTVLILPAAWILAEFFRSFIVSIIAAGPGGTFAANFNFGNLGYAAGALPIGFAGRIVGLYGLSVLAVLANVVLFWALQKRFKPLVVFSIVVAIITTAGYWWPTSHSQPIRVGTVQLPADGEYYFDELAKQIKNSGDRPIQLLVLPEYSFYLENSVPAQQKAIAGTAFGKNEGLIVYTRHGPMIGNKPTNQTVVVDQSSSIVATQDKSFLIPSGEYLPWVISVALRLTGNVNLVHFFDANVAVAKSSSKERPIRAQGLVLGSLACSGAITPGEYQILSHQGAEMLVNTASLNQFRKAVWYHQQARQFARFQAIANDRPFVQAAKGGNSYIVSRNGVFVEEPTHAGQQFISASVQTNSKQVPYSMLGEWVPVIAITILVLVACRTMRPTT